MNGNKEERMWVENQRDLRNCLWEMNVFFFDFIIVMKQGAS